MTPLPLRNLEIRLAPDAAYVRQQAREVAELLGFDLNNQTRIATAVSEIARNAWQYAGGGTVTLSLIPATAQASQAFIIQVADEGPGIRDVNSVLRGECADPQKGGKSIFGARCVMDTFDIETTPGTGTVVTMGKHLPRHVPPHFAENIFMALDELTQRPPHSPLEELHRQNQELLQTLRQIETQQADWERLYREMEVTNRDMLAVHDELSEQNEALGRSEARFRQMVDEVKDYAIFLLDSEGHVATWNRGAERTLGYGDSDILGRSGDAIFLPEEQERPLRERQAARETGRAEDEHWHVRKDGSRFWASSMLTALWSGEELVGYVKILRDITERKQAQDTLQAAYKREQHIAQVLQSPLIGEVPEDLLPGLSVVTFYESALDEAEVGGDFFDAFALPGGQVVLAVGDASGKGLEASLRARRVKELLRAAFFLVTDPSPVQVVTRLNAYLSGANQVGRAGAFDAVDTSGFVTLALVVLDPVTGQGSSISAACEPPLLLRASGDPETLEAPGVPLGVEATTPYEESLFHLDFGDTLILLTDGVTEARSRRNFLGYGGMIALAQEGMSSPSLREMGSVLLEGARSFADGNLRDDACLLLVKRKR